VFSADPADTAKVCLFVALLLGRVATVGATSADERTVSAKFMTIREDRIL
jgi:hypothetical protein